MQVEIKINLVRSFAAEVIDKSKTAYLRNDSAPVKDRVSQSTIAILYGGRLPLTIISLDRDTSRLCSSSNTECAPKL
jgi:hypothetical protein